MVGMINNPQNSNMHNGDTPLVKTLVEPQKVKMPPVYTNQEANNQFNALEHDVYQGIKHSPKIKRGGFPTILKILLGTGGLAAAIIFRKDLTHFAKKIFKNLFKI